MLSDKASFINKTDESITITKGKHELPFEFVIPNNSLESYSGKNAWIKYEVKATIDKKLKGDINESISFDVVGTGTEFTNVSSSNPMLISDRNSKGFEVKLEVEKSIYKIGDKINGRVILQNYDEKIRGIEVILTATERATASGRTELSIIEEYNHKLNYDKENESLPFEIHIPQRVPKSYRGRYSELYWTIKAKVDIPMSSDLNALSKIEIV